MVPAGRACAACGSARAMKCLATRERGRALVELAASESPPLRWSAGSDAVQMVDARLAELKAELDAGRALSASVDGEWA